ncbi:MAG: DNA-binding transcriptional regulator Fis [Pseudomonadales bacterium]|nr:DNA-binding transcriptional regulator Fis [Pseudomonadales bacterium]
MNDLIQLQERENQRSALIPGQVTLVSDKAKTSDNHVVATSLAVNERVSGQENATHSATTEAFTLSNSVKLTVSGYLDAMQDQDVEGLYELVLAEIEAPLLESVMKTAGNNQSLAAKMLGLNRGTLRKKLKKYGML